MVVLTLILLIQLGAQTKDCSDEPSGQLLSYAQLMGTGTKRPEPLGETNNDGNNEFKLCKCRNVCMLCIFVLHWQ